MPFDDPPLYLRQMLNSIALIREFTEGYTPERLHADRRTESAVERELQIITEAAHRLGDQASTLCPGPDWRNIRGLGNVLRHAYDSIRPERLWDVIQIELPKLEKDISVALERMGKKVEGD